MPAWRAHNTAAAGLKLLRPPRCNRPADHGTWEDTTGLLAPWVDPLVSPLPGCCFSLKKPGALACRLRVAERGPCGARRACCAQGGPLSIQNTLNYYLNELKWPRS